MFAPNLPTAVRSLFSWVQARRDRPTPYPRFDGVGMSNASLYLVEGQRTLDVRTGGDYTRQRTKRAGRVL